MSVPSSSRGSVALDTLTTLSEELQQLNKEAETLELSLKEYIATTTTLEKIQSKCIKEFQHQKYRLGQIFSGLKHVKPTSEEEKQASDKLRQQIEEKQNRLQAIESDLPSANGLYLQIVLGSVNLSLRDFEKFRYKDEYERFKLKVTVFIVLASALCIVAHYRVLDAILHFLLVWYYCTLTIRESILVVNGSRIKGWWRIYHFMTTAHSGVIILWPDGELYAMFRRQFTFYVLFINGFRSWMWKGLSFLLPFLYCAYAYQLYNAYILYKLSRHPLCNFWQVPLLAVIFFVIFLGNLITTSLVIVHKCRRKNGVAAKKGKTN